MTSSSVRLVGRLVALLVSACAIVSAAAHAQERAVISSDGAPKAIGPYSQAIKVGESGLSVRPDCARPHGQD